MKNTVRALRMRQSLAQGQLAEAMGVSRQTINSIENERYTPSLPLALALARYFGVTVEEIKEVLLQVAVYCGVPAGMDSFRNAREAIKDVQGK